MSREQPEWDIFKRIESLEKLSLTVDDLTKLAVTTFFILFADIAFNKPTGARKFKDMVVRFLKQYGLTTETLNQLEKIMLVVCNEAEK